jgi:hypothetical protein
MKKLAINHRLAQALEGRLMAELGQSLYSFQYAKSHQ